MGSLPYQSPKEAIEFVKKVSGTLPFMPQLPESHPEEDMIAQVVRGFEIGGWDNLCCSSWELFFETFLHSPRLKIQVAGPFTVARTLSQPYEGVFLNWISFWKGLRDQIDKLTFSGELWVQIDEPFWNAKTPLPDSYGNLLCSVRGSRKKTRVGIHSCATERPLLDKKFAALADFISLNYLDKTFTLADRDQWESIWPLGRTQLVAGILDRNRSVDPPAGVPAERLLISPVCGLYGWTQKEIARLF